MEKILVVEMNARQQKIILAALGALRVLTEEIASEENLAEQRDIIDLVLGAHEAEEVQSGGLSDEGKRIIATALGVTAGFIDVGQLPREIVGGCSTDELQDLSRYVGTL